MKGEGEGEGEGRGPGFMSKGVKRLLWGMEVLSKQMWAKILKDDG